MNAAAFANRHPRGLARKFQPADRHQSLTQENFRSGPDRGVTDNRHMRNQLDVWTNLGIRANHTKRPNGSDGSICACGSTTDN